MKPQPQSPAAMGTPVGAPPCKEGAPQVPLEVLGKRSSATGLVEVIRRCVRGFERGKQPGELGWVRDIDLERVRSSACVRGCTSLVEDVEPWVWERRALCYAIGREIRQGKDAGGQMTFCWTFLAVGKPGSYVTFWVSAGPAVPR